MVRKVLTSEPSPVTKHAVTLSLCTSKPQHLLYTTFIVADSFLGRSHGGG
jgi:hypothetical protein